MLKLRILDILEEKQKTKYWLCKRMEMHYVSFNKMVNNHTDSIRFDTLYRLSKILEVPVGDLFEDTDEVTTPILNDDKSSNKSKDTSRNL